MKAPGPLRLTSPASSIPITPVILCSYSIINNASVNHPSLRSAQEGACLPPGESLGFLRHREACRHSSKGVTSHGSRGTISSFCIANACVRMFWKEFTSRSSTRPQRGHLCTRTDKTSATVFPHRPKCLRGAGRVHPGNLYQAGISWLYCNNRTKAEQ